MKEENIWGRKTFGGGKHLGRENLIEGKHLGEENIWGRKTFGDEKFN